jgi:hypothetical protein
VTSENGLLDKEKNFTEPKNKDQMREERRGRKVHFIRGVKTTPKKEEIPG